jgi:hypothetical protein
MLDKKYGYYSTALAKTSEPIRNTKWLVNFNFSEFNSSSSFSNSDMLSFHVKNVDIPSVQSTMDSIYYHGFERKLPASVDNAGSVSMTILEGENLIGYNALLRWHQACMNGGQFTDGSVSLMDNPLNSTYSLNSPNYSNGEFVNNNVINIQCFSYVTGAEIFRVNFINIKPSKIGGVKLAYEGNELYKFDVTFDYDLPIFVKASPASGNAVIPRRIEI